MAHDQVMQYWKKHLPSKKKNTIAQHWNETRYTTLVQQIDDPATVRANFNRLVPVQHREEFAIVRTMMQKSRS